MSTELTIDDVAVERVRTYRKWLKEDHRYYATLSEDRKGTAPRMPPLPSKTDFAMSDLAEGKRSANKERWNPAWDKVIHPRLPPRLRG